MEEDLPHVSQFIQIHVGQTDECKRQEGLTVPPHREVGKQVALKGEGQKNLNATHFVRLTLTGHYCPSWDNKSAR